MTLLRDIVGASGNRRCADGDAVEDGTRWGTHVESGRSSGGRWARVCRSRSLRSKVEDTAKKVRQANWRHLYRLAVDRTLGSRGQASILSPCRHFVMASSSRWNVDCYLARQCSGAAFFKLRKVPNNIRCKYAVLLLLLWVQCSFCAGLGVRFDYRLTAENAWWRFIPTLNVA